MKSGCFKLLFTDITVSFTQIRTTFVLHLPEQVHSMQELNKIRELLSQGEVEQTIRALDEYLSRPEIPQKDEAYYLRGNAYRKAGNWQQALNNYQQAIDINPESPAADARKMAIDILNFYHKDMYNQ